MDPRQWSKQTPPLKVSGILCSFFSRSIVENYLKNLLDKNESNSIHFSFSKWIFSFSRSILGDDLKTLRNQSEWNPLHFLFSNESFLSVYLLSTIIQTVSSIESKWNPLLYFLKMRYSFSRSIVEKDQNTVVDQKWLELTSLSADGISLFSRFIVDNDSNSLLDWKWAESTSLSLIEFFPFYRSILGDDRNQGGKADPRSAELQ